MQASEGLLQLPTAAVARPSFHDEDWVAVQQAYQRTIPSCFAEQGYKTCRHSNSLCRWGLARRAPAFAAKWNPQQLRL